MKNVLLGFFLLLTVAALGQDSDKDPKPEIDSLEFFEFMYLGEAFPFDSGVAISYPQYDFIFSKAKTSRIIGKYKDADRPPQVIVMPAEEKKRIRPWVWTALGTVAGVVLKSVL